MPKKQTDWGDTYEMVSTLELRHLRAVESKALKVIATEVGDTVTDKNENFAVRLGRCMLVALTVGPALIASALKYFSR